ncbi:phosphoserine phosphatase SerB [Janibacter limosus]|uniref:phosphoserine phosphatase n=1 Tax=Janibacter limosus TaxID=53458 RepID=A0A4P6MSC5_9MICO|nr:phosphoserine phosphatase SerB [Janibacter limosus]QBF45889.1 phosphoserine phosphatase SerB [Janibacter limosus]
MARTPGSTDQAPAPALPGEGPLVLVMDVDSTLIRDEVIELIAEHAGTREQVAAVTEAAMRGELDFAQSLHARVATLEGLPVEVLDRVRAAVRLTPGARTLVTTLVESGHTVGLVSGGFTEVVDDLASELGIAQARANHLEIIDGHLTGKVLGDVVDRAAKAEFVIRLAAASGIEMDRTVAVGDGANDLDMMAAAQLGIAFCAKPAVREQADVSIDEPDLRRVLDILGIDPLPQPDDEGGHPLT